jgi:hypothetical protein
MRVMSAPSSAYSLILPPSINPTKAQPRSDFVYLLKRNGATITCQHVATHPLPDAGQVEVVGQLVVEGIAQIPAVSKIQARLVDGLAQVGRPEARQLALARVHTTIAMR